MLNRIRKSVTQGTATALVAIAMALPAGAETLADALAGAYKHSGLIDQNRAVLRAADEDVAQAVSTLRPVISWSGNVQHQFGTSRAFNTTAGGFVTGSSSTDTASLNLIAELTLYAGGGNLLRIEAAKETVLATRAQLVGIEQQVLLRAVTAYMEVRRANETVALRQNNVRVLRQEVRAARDRFDVGEVTRTDVALAEARMAAAVSALAGAQGNLVAAKEEYRNAVGRAPGNLATPGKLPYLPGTVRKAKTLAVSQHPNLIAVQHQVSAAEFGIKIAESAQKPTVSLRGTYGVTETFGSQAYTHGGTIGVNAGGAIYQGGRLTSLVRQAHASRDQARGGLHITRHNIEQNVGSAYVQLDVARASRSSFESQVRAARTAFRGVREEAKLGARTTLDVLDAEQELLDARANLISSQVDETIAAYTALASVGQLTADALRLNVPKYDPASYYNLVKDAPLQRSQQGQELDRVLKALGKD